MTSASGVRELDRLSERRAAYEERMRAELSLMDQLGRAEERVEAAQQERTVVLAAMAQVSGSAAAAATTLGLREADITAAVKAADTDAVGEVVAGLKSGRRRRKASSASSDDGA